MSDKEKEIEERTKRIHVKGVCKCCDNFSVLLTLAKEEEDKKWWERIEKLEKKNRQVKNTGNSYDDAFNDGHYNGYGTALDDLLELN